MKVALSMLVGVGAWLGGSYMSFPSLPVELVLAVGCTAAVLTFDLKGGR